MSLKELLKDLSWLQKETYKRDNVAVILIKNLYLENNSFEKIKQKINCAHIKLTTKSEFDNNIKKYDIVLKQNYTESEFINFLKLLDIVEKVIYSDSIIWTNERKYWVHNAYNLSTTFSWRFYEIPCIHDVCIPDAEKISFESLVRKLSSKNNGRYFATHFVNSLNLLDKSFNAVKEKVKSVYISYIKNNKPYHIVLRKHYTESEFLEFLQELDIDEKEINNFKSLAWTNEPAIYYEYDNYYSTWRKKYIIGIM